MYRVLIVDDEPMIRLGLASTVDWEKEGLELVGQAANGEEALRQAGGGIDILITDIKMPLMDGLELTRRLKERNPLIRVILISSYSDFEFAREAVKLGVVVDYLLKPTMEPEDLQRILRTCKRQLAEEKRKIEAEQKFGSERNRDRLKRFASVLKKRLSGHADVPAWQPPWLGEHLLVAVWSLDTGEQDSHDAMEHLLKLEHALEKLAEWEERSVSFLTGETELTMLLNDDRHDGLSRIGQWHRRLVDRGISFTVGVSPDFHSLDTFADAYEWAGYALEQSFFMGKGRCYQGEIMRRVNESANPGNSGRWPRLREQFSGPWPGAIAPKAPKPCVTSFRCGTYARMAKTRSWGRRKVC